MRINFAKDVGIPLGVGVADVALAFWDEKRLAQNPANMQFEPIFGPVAAVAGIGMMAGNFYTGVGEVIAHSALPLAIRSIYAWAKSQGWLGISGQRMARAMPVQTAQVLQAASPMRRVGYGWPAQTDKPEFNYPPAF